MAAATRTRARVASPVENPGENAALEPGSVEPSRCPRIRTRAAELEVGFLQFVHVASRGSDRIGLRV